MIQIGHRIWIVEREEFTDVYFDGKPVGLIQELSLEWSVALKKPKKYCSVLVFEAAEACRLETFAIELTNHGFGVEVVYPTKKTVEYYAAGDKVIREEKVIIA